MIGEVAALRQSGIRIVTCCGWGATALLLALALMLERELLAAAVLSALVNLMPTRAVLTERSDASARAMIGVMAAVQPALLVFAMRSTGWQVDMHLYFLVALAALTALCDLRPIIIAAALIALHHAALALLAPEWVFAGGGGLLRVAIHALAVAMMGVILCYLSLAQGRILRQLHETSATAQRQAEGIRMAQAHAEAERTKREQVKLDILEARKAEYARVAEDFERKVTAVTHSVSSTARLLEQATKALDEVASETRDRASEVAGSAEAATRTARTVARGVAELSESIASIAINVGQQKDLTSRATERSSGGGEAVGSLSERSDTIGEATRAIVRIAERTNLLSLNAAIEAASAGPAGRGFTIVAQEVKALAHQAAQAATEIDDLLSGVRSGTLEAERSFAAIDNVVAELDRAAIAIRRDVEMQRKSADLIEGYAQRAADDVSAVAERSRSLANTAQTAQNLSRDLDRAAAQLLENVRTLENSTDSFAGHLRSA